MEFAETTVFGTHIVIIGDTHNDSKEETFGYNMCKRYRPDIICVENGINDLNDGSKPVDKGISTYIDEENQSVEVIGIDKVGLVMSRLVRLMSDEMKERYEKAAQDDGQSAVGKEEHTKKRKRAKEQSTEFFKVALEEREEEFVFSIIQVVKEKSPETILVSVGDGHVHPTKQGLEMFAHSHL